MTSNTPPSTPNPVAPAGAIADHDDFGDYGPNNVDDGLFLRIVEAEEATPPCIFCKRSEGAGETCCATSKVIGVVYELEKQLQEQADMVAGVTYEAQVWKDNYEQMKTKLTANESATILQVYLSLTDLGCLLSDGRRIYTPLAWYPRLYNAAPVQRERYELAASGRGIHWPELDEDLSLAGMLEGRLALAPQPGSESQKKGDG